MWYIYLMNRTVIQLRPFSRYFDELVSQGKLLIRDFEEFEWLLVKNPQSGDVISGLSGLRKTRLKASNKGKRGGFRVDYLDVPEKEKLYLVVLYAKNLKEDLDPEEKRIIGQLVKQLKEEASHG